MKSKELREQRARLVADAQVLIPATGRMSDEVRTKFDAMMADADVLHADITRYERAEAAQSEIRADGPGVSGDAKVAEENYRKAFRGVLTAKREALAQRTADFEKAASELRSLPAFRAMSVGTGSQGGFFVPSGFQYEIETALKAFGGMRKVATIVETATGNPLPWPTSNDTGTSGELVGENQTVTFAQANLGQVTLGAYKYSTKGVQVSIELMQDSAFDIEAYLKEQLVIRLGRITNNHFTVGTGVSQPKGILAVGSAVAGPTAQAVGAVSYIDLVELEHSVDPAYRIGAKFMLHDSTLKLIKELKDSLGRPLWLAAIANNAPDTILGYPYQINQDMPLIGTGNKQLLFGALNKYGIRIVKELTVQRLDERYAELGQVAFIGFARYDGSLIDAGTNPVKYLVGA